jgi:mycothiol system anti-sigma-R factor
MKGCDDCSATTQLYLDKELRGHDLEEFRAHLRKCATCRTRLEEEERLSSLLRRSWPLYLAPEFLRERVAQTAAGRHTEDNRGL